MGSTPTSLAQYVGHLRKSAKRRVLKTRDIVGSTPTVAIIGAVADYGWRASRVI